MSIKISVDVSSQLSLTVARSRPVGSGYCKQIVRIMDNYRLLIGIPRPLAEKVCQTFEFSESMPMATCVNEVVTSYIADFAKSDWKIRITPKKELVDHVRASPTFRPETSDMIIKLAGLKDIYRRELIRNVLMFAVDKKQTDNNNNNNNNNKETNMSDRDKSDSKQSSFDPNSKQSSFDRPAMYAEGPVATSGFLRPEGDIKIPDRTTVTMVDMPSDMVNNMQPDMANNMPADIPASVTNVKLSKSGTLLLRVSGCTLVPDNPEELLDNLVEILEAKGSKIHESQWFKRLQREHPIITIESAPTVNKILAHMQDEPWTAKDQLIEDLLGHITNPKARPVGALAQRLAGMARDNDLETKTDNDILYYRIPLPEPKTDEESILNLLIDKAEGDWVNNSYIGRNLYLQDDDQRHLVIGRMMSMVSSQKVETRATKGERQWRAIIVKK